MIAVFLPSLLLRESSSAAVRQADDFSYRGTGSVLFLPPLVFPDSRRTVVEAVKSVSCLSDPAHGDILYF